MIWHLSLNGQIIKSKDDRYPWDKPVDDIPDPEELVLLRDAIRAAPPVRTTAMTASAEPVAPPALWDGGWDYDMSRLPNGFHEVAFHTIGTNVAIVERIIVGPTLTPAGFPIPVEDYQREYRDQKGHRHDFQAAYAWRRIAIPPTRGSVRCNETDADAERWVMNYTPDFVREYIARKVTATPPSDAAREALVQAQKAILTLPLDALGYGEDEAGRWPLRDELLSNIHAALSAAPVSAWQDVETAPMDVEVLMGWWANWPELHFEMASGLYGSTRGGWLHGQAKFWQPLPAPPSMPRNEGNSHG